MSLGMSMPPEASARADDGPRLSGATRKGLAVVPSQWVVNNEATNRARAQLVSGVAAYEVGPEPTNLLGELRSESKLLNTRTAREAEDRRRRRKYGDGCFGRIARSPIFENVTIGVVMCNAVEIGVDADYSARHVTSGNFFEASPGFIVCEVFFCVYFTLEILLRFIAYKTKWRCVLDGWFMFDTTLVSMMLVETVVLPFAGGSSRSQLSVLRLLRLLRITRMAKLMRAFPQLMMIIKGISAALRAVMWTAVLLVMITYTFSILFTNQYHQGWKSDAEVVEEGLVIEEFFGSMGKSMLSLLIMGTILDDVTACSDAIRATGELEMLICFVFYILLNSFTMMNMLLGILVEVVGNTSEKEKEHLIEETVKESIMTIFLRMDKDSSGKISRREFSEMKTDQKVMGALRALNIEEKEFDMYVELLFSPHKTEDDEEGETTIGFQELLDCICRLRPGSMVSALDFAAFRETVLQSQDGVSQRINRIEEICARLDPCLAPLVAQTLVEAVETDFDDRQSEPSPRRIKLSMLSELEHTASAEIISELQRRLRLPNLEETGVPLSLMDEELQSRFLAADAFQPLGAPRSDPEWSGQAEVW